LLASGALLADNHTVLFDRQVDYSRFRTFTIRDGDLKSRRPEFDNPIVIKNLAGSIRAGLVAKGLKKAGDAADLHVEFHVTTVDYDTNKWGVTREVNDGSAGRGRRGPGRHEAALEVPAQEDAGKMIDGTRSLFMRKSDRLRNSRGTRKRGT
jgi:hypothetical protein